MTNLTITPETIQSLQAFATETGRDVNGLAEDAINGYLAWHETEKALIRQRMEEVHHGKTISAPDVWKKFGLED